MLSSSSRSGLTRNLVPNAATTSPAVATNASEIASTRLRCRKSMAHRTSSMPDRPQGVPGEAVWNASEREWELGTRRDGHEVGDWTWWRADGTLVCKSTFDDAGQLHGIARRWHPNGELSLVAPYIRGKLHGKQIATRPSAGDSPEMRELLELEGVYRSELLYVDGEAQD